MGAAEIHKYLSQFTKCGSCSAVFPAEGIKYVMVNVPSPCCGAPGPRIIWPDPALALYLETARRQDPNEEATPRIKVLMLAAAAELMMEQVVWAALESRIKSAAVAMALMDRCQGVHQLKGVFKDLTSASVDEVLKRESFASFAKTWQEVAQARNRVAHGGWDHKAVDNASLIAFAEALIPACAALWNVAVRP
jgi:hypothetical protein